MLYFDLSLVFKFRASDCKVATAFLCLCSQFLSLNSVNFVLFLAFKRFFKRPYHMHSGFTQLPNDSDFTIYYDNNLELLELVWLVGEFFILLF